MNTCHGTVRRTPDQGWEWSHRVHPFQFRARLGYGGQPGVEDALVVLFQNCELVPWTYRCLLDSFSSIHVREPGRYKTCAPQCSLRARVPSYAIGNRQELGPKVGSSPSVQHQLAKDLQKAPGTNPLSREVCSQRHGEYRYPNIVSTPKADCNSHGGDTPISEAHILRPSHPCHRALIPE